MVCAVQGVAAGAGANLALACDFVLAAKKARFIQSFSNVGIVPDSGGTYFLPRLVGLARANVLMMLGESLTGEEAASIGLIFRAVEDDVLEEESDKLAARLAAMPTKGIGLTKRALNQSFDNSLDEQLDLERDLQTIAGNTSDYREGVAAFLEKRKPKFSGQ